MVKETIRIFARLKPIRKGPPIGQYELSTDIEGTPKLITFSLPKDASKGFINNKKQLYKFSFEQIFDVEANQGEVFTAVAKPVIDQVLQGYNGTVFAYGQTGSGKTYTITGGGSHESRGIIPLTVEYIFKHYKQNQDSEFTTHISYLEVYNDVGRDLLTAGDVRGIDDLSKVTPMEDVDQNIHLKNLSIHTVSSREEALDLLFQGDFNRVVAATPMNPGSTRSHCIYTIHIMSRLVGSSTFRRAKFHLVDLAGSERVSKTGASGILLTEAKFINESLHHLEKVIVALSEPGRSHIPYRDSIVTNVLRDSLGGNCMTTMIATCSVEKSNIDETISTCRFAQRVAMIKNDVELNEEVDPKLLIDKLKRDIVQLKEELSLLSGEQRSDALTEEDVARCESALTAFLQDTDPEATLSVGTDLRKIQLCFQLMKRRLKDTNSREIHRPHASEFMKDDGTSSPNSAQPSSSSSPYESKELEKLCSLLQQRDNEISILVNLLKKEKKKLVQAKEATADYQAQSGNEESYPRRVSSSSSSFLSQDSDASLTADGRQHAVDDYSKRNYNKLEKSLFGDMSTGRKEAFELFKRDHELYQKMEKERRDLRQLHLDARQLGEELKQSKTVLGELTVELKKYRMLRVLEGSDDKANTGVPDVKENSLLQSIVEEQKRFKNLVAELKLVKEKCDHMEQSLAKDKLMIVRSFDVWWADQAARLQRHQDKSGRLAGNRLDKPVWQNSTTASHAPLTHETSSMSHHSQLNSLLPNNRGRSSTPSSLTVTLQPLSLESHPPTPETRGHHSRVPQSSSSSSSSSLTSVNRIMSTGDPQIDETIQKFYYARQNYCQQVLRQGPE